MPCLICNKEHRGGLCLWKDASGEDVDNGFAPGDMLCFPCAQMVIRRLGKKNFYTSEEFIAAGLLSGIPTNRSPYSFPTAEQNSWSTSDVIRENYTQDNTYLKEENREGEKKSIPTPRRGGFNLKKII